MHTPAIYAHQLTVSRGKKLVLDTISFTIEPGTLTGLIGPSGSGKTTLMRSIVGAQRVTSGTLELFGVHAGRSELRSRVGYMAQAHAVYQDLTVLQNLRYFGMIVHANDTEQREILRIVDLEPQTHQVVGTLSGGQLARVSLAVALLGSPDLLVLDEPTVGLDPVLRRDLWQLFHRLAKDGKTLLISSHVMDEAEQCHALILLREGKVLAHGAKQLLLQNTRTKTVEQAFLRLVEGRNDA